MAKISTLMLTKNNCYKTGKTHSPRGVMWHSTGANNPYLSRYLPNDGVIGGNKYGNHWNQPKPDGRSVCVHAFIGYTKDKKDVRTYQTLPWNRVGWHSGFGRNGSANTRGYIGFEICEDGLSDKKYFNEVYRQGVELTAYICKRYSIPVNSTTVIDHTGGNKMGIASNHGDVMHWFRKHGKTMADVRRDVKALMNDGNFKVTASSPSVGNVSGGSAWYGIGSKYNTRTSVRGLQNDLVSLGFPVGSTGADGYMGNNTRSAIVAFQRKHGLSADGKAGPATLAKIKQEKSTPNRSEPVIETVKPKVKRIAEDGYWGEDTTKALQRELKTYVDGIISGQYSNSTTKNIGGVSFSTKTGSNVVKALQKKVGVKQDGYLGPNTIKALQKYLGTYQDGVISRPSNVVKAMQKRLNSGNF